MTASGQAICEVDLKTAARYGRAHGVNRADDGKAH